ncbi:twin-arginine translocation signal domain-containing protein [Streptomyces sp. NPDC102473]|uniref:twin-arginine translocation signal domain-containing protein n=1 Tax=Streptomyces sp. NPDC102473 TaxID=3366180 RepID=UPI0038089BE9
MRPVDVWAEQHAYLRARLTRRGVLRTSAATAAVVGTGVASGLTSPPAYAAAPDVTEAEGPGGPKGCLSERSCRRTPSPDVPQANWRTSWTASGPRHARRRRHRAVHRWRSPRAAPSRPDHIKAEVLSRSRDRRRLRPNGTVC